MNITEVRVKLMRNRTDRLRAFCSVTIDNDFVVHDLRVIEGRKGYFVAMPSRKLADGCAECGYKNDLKDRFCGHCGGRLGEKRSAGQDRDKLHVDVAHPINTPCREMLQRTVLAAYEAEAARAGESPPPPVSEDEPYEEEGLEDLGAGYGGFVEEGVELEEFAPTDEPQELDLGEEADLEEAEPEAEFVHEPEPEFEEEPEEPEELEEPEEPEAVEEPEKPEEPKPRPGRAKDRPRADDGFGAGIF